MTKCRKILDYFLSRRRFSGKILAESRYETSLWLRTVSEFSKILFLRPFLVTLWALLSKIGAGKSLVKSGMESIWPLGLAIVVIVVDEKVKVVVSSGGIVETGVVVVEDVGTVVVERGLMLW